MKKSFAKVFSLSLALLLLLCAASCKDGAPSETTTANIAATSSDTTSPNTTSSDTASLNENTTKNSDKDKTQIKEPDTTMNAEESNRLNTFLSASPNNLKNFSFTLVSYKYNGKTTEKGYTQTVYYCDDGFAFYTDNGKNGTVYLNDGPKYYSFNLPKKTKKLITEGEYASSSVSWDAAFSSYGAMLTAHTAYTANQFNYKGEDEIAGRKCIKYAITGSNISDDTEITFWIDTETGLLLKSINKTKLSGVTSLNMWEMSAFNVGDQNLNKFKSLKG